MEQSRVTSKGPCSKGEGNTKHLKENTSIMKHYPWLDTFDKDARTYLTAQEMTIGHVLKLLTFMEGNVSLEVARLKTRPNRATKFLTEMRKKIILIKKGGLRIESESERKLFPTYGLLLVHVVHISLASSKIERLGSDKVARELYDILKLMFQGDCEYVLDVALCSNLDEHADSRVKVGFQLFSFIVKDWPLYLDSKSSQMKYYAICSLLSEASKEGQQVVDQYMPNKNVETQFCNFLKDQMDIELNKKTKVNFNFKGLIKLIKPIAIKSISRGRLVLVSKRDVAGGRRDHTGGSSDSSSTIVNMVTSTSYSSTQSEIPSSSFGYDPMNIILGELGLGENASLDTVGGMEDCSNKSDNKIITDDVMNQNDQVSSSTRSQFSTHQSYFIAAVNKTPNTESGDIKIEKFEKMDANEESDEKEDVLLPMYNNDQGKRFVYSSPERYEQDSSSRVEVTTCLDYEKDTSSADNVIMADKSGESTLNVPDVTNKISGSSSAEAVADSDSELEVLSEVEVEPMYCGRSRRSRRSRDEAEAESGEDVVPNYGIDSDAEGHSNHDSTVNSTIIGGTASDTEENHNNIGTYTDSSCTDHDDKAKNRNSGKYIPATSSEDIDGAVANDVVQSSESIIDEISPEKLLDSPLHSDKERPTEAPSSSRRRTRKRKRAKLDNSDKAIKSCNSNLNIDLKLDSTLVTRATRGRKNKRNSPSVQK